MRLETIQLQRRIAEFWSWFQKKEPFLYYGTENEQDRMSIMTELSEQLKQLNKHLVFELSPIQDEEFKELVISADGIKEAFTAVTQLIKYAPKHPFWQFTAFRPRMESDDISISMGSVDFSYEDLFFRYVLTDQEFGVELNIRNFQNTDWEKNALFILLDALIGEYDAVNEIDWVEWVPLDEAESDNLFPFVELRDIIDERKRKRA